MTVRAILAGCDEKADSSVCSVSRSHMHSIGAAADLGLTSQERGFVVHLVGGGHIKMMLEATDLSDVQNTLLRQRALIGRHLFLSDYGIEESIPALIPSNRIQMVILDEH